VRAVLGLGAALLAAAIACEKPRAPQSRTYAIEVTDPPPRDGVLYVLQAAPPGKMTIDETGRIRWVESSTR
jgi:hypothetical protein